MPTVVLTIDCEAANYSRRCYAAELIEVAEKERVPLTWMICVTGKDPMSSVQLYHQEYLHRIPSWHELGLHLHFEDDNGHVEDAEKRADLIRLGYNVLKTCHVKPTSFRAGSFALMPSDVEYIENLGILVDSSGIPDAEYKKFVDWTGAPKQPYHPDYNDLTKEGNSKLLEAPLATHEGVVAYLNGEFGKSQSLLEYHAEHSEVVVVGGHDYNNSAEVLQSAIKLFKSKDARFTTLTNLVSHAY